MTCLNYCVLVCPRYGAANWKSEIRPSTAKKGINDVKLICDVCGYVAFSTEDIERLAQPQALVVTSYFTDRIKMGEEIWREK